MHVVTAVKFSALAFSIIIIAAAFLSTVFRALFSQRRHHSCEDWAYSESAQGYRYSDENIEIH